MKPTKEEMLDFLRTIRANGGFDIRLEKWWRQKDQDMFDAVRAFIESKRTVTDKWIGDFIIAIYAAIKKGEVGELIEKKLAELGISIEDKGNVPIISEEGFSNEEKP